MKNLFVLFALIMFVTGCDKDDESDKISTPVVLTATGDISEKLDQFRNLLGATLNTSPGQVSGRREINWDGVPEQFSTERLPSNFFNQTSPGTPASLQRGFTYSADVDARVSSNNFADLDPSNATEFAAFSGTKTFSAVSANLWNVDFEVPGQSTKASVRGFGAVFSDVDKSGAASMEFFSGDRSLGVFLVPPHTTGSFSFLGVYFPNEKVTRIRIKQGEGVVASGAKDLSSGGINDIVIMDDFLYDEPIAL